MSHKPMVVAFIGQDRNGCSRHVSTMTNNGLTDLGLATGIVDLAKPGHSDDFAALVASHPLLFCYGFQGVGARLTHPSGQNLWDRLQVPFLSLLFDHPCYMPANHSVDSEYVISCYHARDFYDVHRCHLTDRQPACLLRPAYEALDHRPRIAWADRDVPLLYLKTGNNPEELSRSWAAFPKTVQSIIWDVVAEAAKGNGPNLVDLLHARLLADDLSIPVRTELFWSLVRNVDDYIRRVRSTRMAEALKPLDALIIGANWDHIDKTGARARFLPPVPAAEGLELFARARFVVNTNPFMNHGFHERAAQGVLFGAAVVTDDNLFTRQHMGDMPSVFRFQWMSDDLTGAIRDFAERTPFTQDDLNLAEHQILQQFASTTYQNRVLEIVRIRRQVHYASGIVSEGFTDPQQANRQHAAE